MESHPGVPGMVGEDRQRDVKDLAQGALVTFVGKLGRSSRGAFIWVLTALYGLEVQALYSLSWGLISTLNKIARFGLQRGVVRFVVAARAQGGGQQGEEVVAAALGVALAAGGVVAWIAFVSADWVASYYDKPIAYSMRVMAWTAPFMAVAWCFLAAIRSLRIMRYDAYITSLAGPLILLVGGVGVGLVEPTLEAVAWVQLAMGVGICLLAAFFFRRFFALGAVLRQVGRRRPSGGLIRFSAPVMAADLLYSLLIQLDVLMLTRFVDREQLHMVGIYVLARRLASTLMKAPQAFDPIFSSVVSTLALEGGEDELRHRFKVISRWILTVNLPVIAAFCLLVNLLPKEALLFVPEVATGVEILFVLMAGMTVQSIFSMIDPLLTMTGRPHLGLLNNTLWLGANLVLNIWAIGRYGIIGAAVGAALAVLLISLVRLCEVRWFFGFIPLHWTQLKPIGAALGAGLGVWAVWPLLAGSWPGSGIAVVLFLGLYLAALKGLGLEAEDRALWARAKERLGRLRGFQPKR
ncbi:MAG: oligosaccharide flippase family protein [Candidatus Latescibacteria bacterium]|nr:oligosaccharide flippase family protein [Candidatus Latescibacterota bacterium]